MTEAYPRAAGHFLQYVRRDKATSLHTTCASRTGHVGKEGEICVNIDSNCRFLPSLSTLTGGFCGCMKTGSNGLDIKLLVLYSKVVQYSTHG